MAALTVQTVTAAGITPAAPVQISAWSSPDTLSGSLVGERGVWAEVTNGSGGSLDLRIQDPGATPAGNAAANGYTTVTVADGATKLVLITKNNVSTADGLVDIGASTTNAAFTIRLFRY